MTKEKQLNLGFFEPPKDAVKLSAQSDISANPEEDRKDGWNIPIKASGDPRALIKEMTKIFENNYRSFGGWGDSFNKALELIYYALKKDEDKYMDLVKKLDKKAVYAAAEVSGILIKALTHDYLIFDYLGEVYMQVASMSKSKAFGQYFTPFHICEFMAKTQLGDIKELIEKSKREGKRITVCDPTVGSGAMLLACKKVIIEEVGLTGLDYFEFYGQDIDQTCVLMCKIQMMLTDYRYMTNLLLIHYFELKEALKNENKL